MRVTYISAAIAALGLGLASGAFAATSNTTTLNVGVDGTTAIDGFGQTITLDNQNPTTLKSPGVTSTLSNLQIYTNDPDGIDIVSTAANVDGNGNPALVYATTNFIPLSITYTPCGTSGTAINLIPDDAAANPTTVSITDSTILTDHYSATACTSTKGSAVFKFGGTTDTPTTITPTTGASHYSTTVDITVAPK